MVGEIEILSNDTHYVVNFENMTIKMKRIGNTDASDLIVKDGVVHISIPSEEDANDEFSFSLSREFQDAYDNWINGIVRKEVLGGS